MAKYQFLLSERSDARFLNRFVDPKETVEIPDEIAVQYEFSPEVWKEITPPKPAAVAAHKRALAAAKKAAEMPTEPVTDTNAGDTTTTEED